MTDFIMNPESKKFLEDIFEKAERPKGGFFDRIKILENPHLPRDTVFVLEKPNDLNRIQYGKFDPEFESPKISPLTRLSYYQSIVVPTYRPIITNICCDVDEPTNSYDWEDFKFDLLCWALIILHGAMIALGLNVN